MTASALISARLACRWRRPPAALRTRLPAAAVILLAAADIAACGSAPKPPAPSAQQQVTGTLRSYLSAQAAGKGRTACGVLTANAQQQLTAVVANAGKGLIPGHLSCPDAVALASAFAGSSLAALARARISQVHVAGSRATADVAATGFPPETVTLVRAGGAWKIAGVPGLAARP